MKAMIRIKCDRCGNTFEPGNRSSGIPNGVCFKCKDRDITMCADCMMEIGSMSEEEHAKEMEKWK